MGLVRFFLGVFHDIVASVCLVTQERLLLRLARGILRFPAWVWLVNDFLNHSVRMSEVRPICPMVALQSFFRVPCLCRFVRHGRHSVFNLRLGNSQFGFRFFFDEYACRSSPLSTLHAFFGEASPRGLFFVVTIGNPLRDLRYSSRAQGLIAIVLRLPLREYDSVRFRFVGPLRLSRCQLSVLFHVLLGRGEVNEHVRYVDGGESKYLVVQASHASLEVARPLKRLEPNLSSSNERFGTNGIGVHVLIRFREG